MRLREAQVLGIMGLIALGVVVVCFWRGGDEPAVGAPGGTDVVQQDEPAAVEIDPDETTNVSLPDLVRLLDEQTRELDRRGHGDVEGAPARIEVQGPPPEPLTPLTPPTPPAPTYGILTPPAPGPEFVTPAAEERTTPIPSWADTLFEDEPEPARVEPEAPLRRTVAPPPPMVHVVEKGESLWKISERYYKVGTRWRDILQANNTQIGGPQDLRPGMKLVIPDLGATVDDHAERPQDGQRAVLAGRGLLPTGRKYYDVLKGDTLWSIARDELRDATRWKEIRDANADLLTDASKLRAGMRLILPE